MCCNEPPPIPDYRPRSLFSSPSRGSSRPSGHSSFSRRERERERCGDAAVLHRIALPLRKSSQTREEGRGGEGKKRGPDPGRGPDISCAHANYSSTAQPCVHMVVHHYPHDTSLHRLVNRHLSRACFRVHSTRRAIARASVSEKPVSRFHDGVIR